MHAVQNLHALCKHVVEQCLKALVFMFVMRLTFIKFACEQVCKQLYYSHVLTNKLE